MTHHMECVAILEPVDKDLTVLKAKVARLVSAQLLDATGVDEATLHFRALCDSLAGLELGGAAAFPTHDGDRIWRTGLRTLVRGFRPDAA